MPEILLGIVVLVLGREMDAYERLLTDTMKGDALLFVRQDEVEAAWAIVDPHTRRYRSYPSVRAGHMGSGRGKSSGGGWLAQSGRKTLRDLSSEINSPETDLRF